MVQFVDGGGGGCWSRLLTREKVQFVDGGGGGGGCWSRFAKSSKKRTSPGKRGRLITLPYLPWWKSEPNFENRLTAIISLSRDKSLAITQHGNTDNGPTPSFYFSNVNTTLHSTYFLSVTIETVN